MQLALLLMSTPLTSVKPPCDVTLGWRTACGVLALPFLLATLLFPHCGYAMCIRMASLL